MYIYIYIHARKHKHRNICVREKKMSALINRQTIYRHVIRRC